MAFPTFFKFSLNLAIRSSWSEPQSAPSLVFADCIEFLHLWLQRLYNQSDVCTGHLMTSMCRVIPCVLGRGCVAMTSAFSWQNSINLCPASFHIPKSNLPVTSGVSWLPTVHSNPLWRKVHLCWVLVLEGHVGLHRTIQLQLFQHDWSGYRLGWLWYWMVYLGNEQRSFCRFWDCIQVLHFGLFCWPWRLIQLILAHRRGYNVIWALFTHSSPFQCADC